MGERTQLPFQVSTTNKKKKLWKIQTHARPRQGRDDINNGLNSCEMYAVNFIGLVHSFLSVTN